jgi:hypothetical protein
MLIQIFFFFFLKYVLVPYIYVVYYSKQHMQREEKENTEEIIFVSFVLVYLLCISIYIRGTIYTKKNSKIEQTSVFTNLWLVEILSCFGG